MSRENTWQEELERLHAIIQKAGLEETVKWGIKVYARNGKNVVSCGGFKHFFTLWFYDGVFLTDPYHVLHTASGGKTKALRQWRFTSGTEINEDRILAYIKEAVRNTDEGKVWKPEKSQPFEVPELLRLALESDPPLKEAFSELAPYKQKEYAEYIHSAQREETKATRLDKIKPMILQGTGLHDKYKKGGN